MIKAIGSRQSFALLIFAVAVAAMAQDQPTQAQDTVAEPAVVDDLRAPVPALLGGDSNSLAFSSELERSNYLRGGISVGATYDDNANNEVNNRISDFSYSILPNIEVDQTRSRLHWVLGYFGGFTANQRLTTRNQGSHNLSGSLQYRLSPHVDLRLSDNFLDTTGLLQQFNNGLGTPVTGPLTQPNTTLITPLAKNINNTGSVDLSYQYSANDSVGVGGTFYDSHFRDQPVGSTPLVDTSTRGANAYYNHRFTARNWTGISYKFQRLEFSPGSDVTLTHSLLLTHTIYLRQHLTVSFYAGPEYSELDTQTVTMNVTPPVISFDTVSTTAHQLSLSSGANLGWQGALTSVHLEASRKVADGGGLLGAVELNSFEGGIRRQLLKPTAVHLNVVYGHNRELASVVAATPLTSASGNFGVEQRLSENFMLRMDYGRDYLKGSTIASTGSVNHNRGTISISYSFSRPMGR
ncbi:MAG TPA: hypothetical protein VLK33_03510 [Terriglobales bacterium]|nr:hypothetical protein [Terriglobales bacterium]